MAPSGRHKEPMAALGTDARHQHGAVDTLDVIARNIARHAEVRSNNESTAKTSAVLTTLDSVVKSISKKAKKSLEVDKVEESGAARKVVLATMDSILSSIVKTSDDASNKEKPSERSQELTNASFAAVAMLDSIVDTVVRSARQDDNQSDSTAARTAVIATLDSIVGSIVEQSFTAAQKPALPEPPSMNIEATAMLDTIVDGIVQRSNNEEAQSEQAEPAGFAVESIAVQQNKKFDSKVNHNLLRPFPASALRENQYNKDNVPETFLHMLPGELRNRIYREIGFPRVRQNLLTLNEPVLAKAIPSLKPEIHSMLFAESTFDVDVYSQFRTHSELINQQRLRSRGDAFGTGKLVIPPDSWILQADRHAVRFRHMCMHICERDGYQIGYLWLKNARADKRMSGPRVSLSGVDSPHTRYRLARSKAATVKYVAKLRTEKDFAGFSLQHLQAIAKLWNNPEGLPRGSLARV